MVNYSMYRKIRNYKENGFSQAEIVRQTGLDWKTVKKYMNMNEKQYGEYLHTVKHRTKCFSPFKADILACYALNNGKELQKSAVYDYLEELHDQLPGTERTLRSYIDFLIDSGELKLGEKNRKYLPVQELPYGQQMQLDFGEYNCGNGLKLYIFASVLSASRYKYSAFQERPFTTDDVIRHLLNCFQYYEGMPEEIVIDQDRTMVVSENRGDIIYTQKFSHFIEEMGLKMYVCRKNDPESKGKVENLVKYVKYNFLAIRSFDGLDEARTKLRKWLSRRANGKISAATRRIPAILFEKEKRYLQPLRASIHLKDSHYVRERRDVNKLCQISYCSCKYPVPEEYRNKNVEVFSADDMLFIFDPGSGEQVGEHRLCLIPGQVVYDKRLLKEREEKVEKLRESMLTWYSLPEWQEFISRNHKRYKRYFRDQYIEARRKLTDGIDIVTLEQALSLCLETEKFTICDLHDTYCYYLQEKSMDIPEVKAVIPGSGRSRKRKKITVSRRGIDYYKNLFESAEEASE